MEGTDQHTDRETGQEAPSHSSHCITQEPTVPGRHTQRHYSTEKIRASNHSKFGPDLAHLPN